MLQSGKFFLFSFRNLPFGEIGRRRDGTTAHRFTAVFKVRQADDKELHSGIGATGLNDGRGREKGKEGKVRMTMRKCS